MLLVERALRLGGAADGLLEGGALFEWEAPVDEQLAAALDPLQTQRATAAQRGVVGDGRGREGACDACDLFCRLVGVACELGVGGGGCELGCGGGLVERHCAGGERFVECRQEAEG